MRDLINRWLWHYWWSQRDHLRARLHEIDAEENNLIEDRKKVQMRLMKAEARVTVYASRGAMK